MTAHLRALVRMGDLDAAMWLCRSLRNPWTVATATHALVMVLLAAGRRAQAETVARAVTDAELRARALLTVATALQAAGHADRAAAVLAEARADIASPDGRFPQRDVAMDLVRALTTGGDVDDAVAVVAGHADPAWHAEAYTILADVRAGHSDEAQR